MPEIHCHQVRSLTHWSLPLHTAGSEPGTWQLSADPRAWQCAHFNQRHVPVRHTCLTSHPGLVSARICMSFNSHSVCLRAGPSWWQRLYVAVKPPVFCAKTADSGRVQCEELCSVWKSWIARPQRLSMTLQGLSTGWLHLGFFEWTSPQTPSASAWIFKERICKKYKDRFGLYL